jgi:18S rRNA (guanine1575-N7)-methyltransferase
MTYRALELLALPEEQSAYVLDIGCGSGLSGELLDEAGHVWVGVDIAPSMLGEWDSRGEWNGLTV